MKLNLLLFLLRIRNGLRDEQKFILLAGSLDTFILCKECHLKNDGVLSPFFVLNQKRNGFSRRREVRHQRPMWHCLELMVDNLLHHMQHPMGM